MIFNGEIIIKIRREVMTMMTMQFNDIQQHIILGHSLPFIVIF